MPFVATESFDARNIPFLHSCSWVSQNARSISSIVYRFVASIINVSFLSTLELPPSNSIADHCANNYMRKQALSRTHWPGNHSSIAFIFSTQNRFWIPCDSVSYRMQNLFIAFPLRSTSKILTHYSANLASFWRKSIFVYCFDISVLLYTIQPWRHQPNLVFEVFKIFWCI